MTCMVQLNTQGPQCYSKKVGSNSLFPPSRYSPSVSCKKASEHVALRRHRAFIPITKAPCLFRTVWRWKTQIRGWKEGVQNKVKSLPPDGIQQIGVICVYFTATKLPVAFDVLKGNQVNCPLVSFYSTKGVTKIRLSFWYIAKNKADVLSYIIEETQESSTGNHTFYINTFPNISFLHFTDVLKTTRLYRELQNNAVLINFPIIL